MPSVTAVLRNRKKKKRQGNKAGRYFYFDAPHSHSLGHLLHTYLVNMLNGGCAPSKRNISAGVTRIPESHPLWHVTSAKIIHGRRLRLSWVILVNTKSTASVFTDHRRQTQERREGKDGDRDCADETTSSGKLEGTRNTCFSGVIEEEWIC